MELFVFTLFACLALVSAIVVVSHRNPVYSVLSLVVTLISLAVLFVLLGAPFLAVLQVLVYTGAILVLFLFVIMLLNVGDEGKNQGGSPFQKWFASISAVLFAGVLLASLWSGRSTEALPLDEELVSLQSLARILFTEYLLPFEIVGLLLLAAVIAATVLAKKSEPVGTEEGQ